MTKLPPESLERQPEEVSRILVLSRLDDVLDASKRIENPEDTEALHDFRVALRRLRSCIRAYRPYLKDAVPKKVRKELRDLASSTNLARDIEVQLDWLKAQSKRLNEAEHKGLTWLVTRLHEHEGESHTERFQRLSLPLAGIRKVLTKKLASWRVYLDQSDKVRPFRTVIGSLIQEQAESLSQQLLAVRAAEDDGLAHAARISAKRLRYLIEPITGTVPEAGSLVRQLKGLQDLLGDLHDANLLVSTIGDAMEESAVEDARRLHRQVLQTTATPKTDRASATAGQEEQAGLLALARLLKQRRDSLFSEIDSRWHGEGLERFVAQAYELAAWLRASSGSEPSVRRFRLTGLPEALQNHPSILVDEGWLPSEEIEDCLCRKRWQGRVRHYRFVRLGAEKKRCKISRRVFARMWPLTSGRRLQKKRYEVIEGGRLWRVDDLGGNVVLAETDVSAGEEVLRLPDWLIPCLREELTGRSKAPSAAARREDGRSGKMDAIPFGPASEEGGTTSISYPQGTIDERSRPNASPPAKPDANA